MSATTTAPVNITSTGEVRNVSWTESVRKPVVIDPDELRAQRKAIEETCAGIEGVHLSAFLMDRLARAELAIKELRR